MDDMGLTRDKGLPGFRAKLASAALKLALRLISIVGRGDHSGVFTDRILDAEFAIQEIGTTYYGWPYYRFDIKQPKET